MTSPVIDGWFTTGPEPALIAAACEVCGARSFPPVGGPCRDPRCAGEAAQRVELARRGTVWSYTDARYQPPPPFVPAADPYEPFAIAAVRLPEGLVVLGQVADGYGVEDLRVGAEVELVVEALEGEGDDERTVWRWRPVAGVEGGGTR